MSERRELSPELKELRRQCILADRAGDDDALYEALRNFQDLARKEFIEVRSGQTPDEGATA